MHTVDPIELANVDEIFWDETREIRRADTSRDPGQKQDRAFMFLPAKFDRLAATAPPHAD